MGFNSGFKGLKTYINIFKISKENLNLTFNVICKLKFLKKNKLF